jgi:hypothetical protein
MKGAFSSDFLTNISALLPFVWFFSDATFTLNYKTKIIIFLFVFNNPNGG